MLHALLGEVAVEDGGLVVGVHEVDGETGFEHARGGWQGTGRARKDAPDHQTFDSVTEGRSERGGDAYAVWPEMELAAAAGPEGGDDSGDVVGAKGVAAGGAGWRQADAEDTKEGDFERAEVFGVKGHAARWLAYTGAARRSESERT